MATQAQLTKPIQPSPGLPAQLAARMSVGSSAARRTSERYR